jgi:putative endopeptidase
MRTKSLLLATLALAAASTLQAADQPLTALPYTPGLDVRAMDTQAAPCEDFYQYACGGWVAGNPIPSDQSSWSVYGKLADENKRYLWGVLDGLAQQKEGRSPAQAQIGDLFAACMDEAGADAKGAAPVAPWLARIDELGHKRELPALLAALHLATADDGLLFGFGQGQDFGDASRVIAFVGAGGLSLPDRDDYLQADARMRRQREAFVAHVARMFTLAGVAPAQARRDAAVVLKIETALARPQLTRVQQRDPQRLHNKADLRALQRLTPGFDWAAYLGGVGLGGLREFNLTEPAFLRTLGQVVQQRPLAELKAYLRWHVLHAWAPLLSQPFAREHFEFFDKTLRGVPEPTPRWKQCVEVVDLHLGDALGQEFVRRNFSPELKERTERMARQIEQAMAARIEAADWMSPATKHKALQKLHAVVNKVGYPDRWRDYGNVRIVRDDLVGNVARAITADQQRELAKIGRPVDRNEWGMTPPTVNAYYNAQTNDINFPAGVLQPPLFDPRMDAAPGYGNTGGTIGHELIHGFDDEGRQFDAAGNLRNWWTPKDERAFNQRAQCLVDQYAQYPVVDDIKINSQLTLGEDLADLGGMVLALAAWQMEVGEATANSKVLPAEFKADGLTPLQRFFVGNAQWACENTRPEQLRLHARTDPHSPGRWRVNGLVANLPEFQQAFACKPGQPMAPLKRCKIW